MIVDTPPVFDRTPHLQKLDNDVAVVTSDLRGLPTVDVILALLHRAEELTQFAIDRGEDLTPIRAFFGSEA
jgi:hypothetical protein